MFLRVKETNYFKKTINNNTLKLIYKTIPEWDEKNIKLELEMAFLDDKTKGFIRPNFVNKRKLLSKEAYKGMASVVKDLNLEYFYEFERYALYRVKLDQGCYLVIVENYMHNNKFGYYMSTAGDLEWRSDEVFTIYHYDYENLLDLIGGNGPKDSESTIRNLMKYVKVGFL